MKQTNRGFRILAHVALIFLCILVVIPLMLLLVSSLSSEQTLLANGYALLPRELTAAAYEYLLRGAGNLFRSYGVTMFVTVVGTALGLFITTLLAYALSIKDLPYRKLISFLVFFTMLFNSGLVPTYMMYTNVFHIKNSIFALIFPYLLVNAFYVIIARSYFSSSIPGEIIEAARIDGAGEVCILFRVVLPMSLPILATLGLMIGLAYWNNWTNGLYFVTDRSLYSVQQLLTEMVNNMQALQSGQFANMDPETLKNMPSTAIRMATAVMSVLPIMVIYPFFQKYFVKGITMGAVKG